jgi:hypothetical protein
MRKHIIIILTITASLLFTLHGAVVFNENDVSEKSCSLQPAHPTRDTPCRDTMIGEGFEDSFPPMRWDTLSAPGGVQGTTLGIPIGWHQTGDPYYHTGLYGAAYGWGYNLDGWLRIVNLDFSSVEYASLSFWWMSSYEWSVDSNNADLFVEASCDAGMTWDTLWTFGDSTDIIASGASWPWANWIWYESIIMLDDYAGAPNVMVGFHVVADDNADISLDDVVLDTIVSAVNEDVTGIPLSGVQFRASFIISDQRATFELILPEAAEVSISVYDILGRFSRMLVSQDFSAGTHRFTRNLNLPAGVYFFIVNTASGKPITQKFLVIK